MNSQVPSPCPCCKGLDTKLLGKLPDNHWFAGKRLETPLPGGSLYRCRVCHLKFRYPIQEFAVYQKLYDNAATLTWPSERDRPDWDLIIEQLRTQLPHGGRVLDFGCYSGGLLARLDDGYERYGVEINRAAAAAALERAGAQIWASTGEIPVGLKFDVIIAADVLEHLPQPDELIALLTRLLTEQGCLILTTGDANNHLWNRFGANWWYCFYPEHITFISEEWLCHASVEAGFSISRCQTFYYLRLTSVSRFLEALYMSAYGFFPATYLRIGNLISRMLGRPRMTSVPGRGVSADHLLLVLRRKFKS